MAKSKRKSGSSTDVSRWETELTQVNLNEDDWRALIVFVVPEQPEDFVHLTIMSDVISSGIRKLFNVIDYESLLKEIKDLAHGKSMKGKIGKPPQFVEIIDQIKNVVDHGEEVSPSLLAKLLKFKLLLLKQRDLERRDEEKKAAELAAKQAKQEHRSHSKAGSAQGKRSKSQSPNRKKGKKEDVLSSPKKDTKLKRRGDLDETIKTIDDEPDDDSSPSYYIVINGVHDAHVLKCLLELGVSTDAVIKFKTEKIEKDIGNCDTEQANDVVEEESKEENTLINEEKLKKVAKLKAVLETFWRENEHVVCDSPAGSKLKDIANLTIHIEKNDIPVGDLSQLSHEIKTDYGTKLFDYAANSCYKLLDSRKRYDRYLKNMKLTHVLSYQETLQDHSLPAEMEETENSSRLKDGADLRYFHHLVNQVPCESQSVGLVLDSLLRQVEATMDEKNLPDDLKTPREDSIDDDLGQHLDNKLKKLGVVGQQTKDDFAHTDIEKSPIIMKYGDETTYRLFHLSKINEIDLKEVEDQMNSLKIFAVPTQFPELQDEDKMAVRTRHQQLLHFCCQNRSMKGVEKLLKLLCIESTALKRVDQDGQVSEFDKANAHGADGYSLKEWDDLFIYLKELFQNEPGNKDDVVQSKNESKAGDSNNNVRRLNSYCYSEYFTKEILVQVLHKALELRPYVDSYYHPGLDSIFLVLHNPKDRRLENKYPWSTWLHSNVGFRNYLDFVAHAIEDWQNEEDVKEEIANRPVVIESPEPEASPAPIKTPNRHNLQTRSELEEAKAMEDEKNKKKGKKARSRSGSPNKQAERQKTKSSEKKERMPSGKKRTPSARKGGSRLGTGKKNKVGQDKKPEDEKIETDVQEEEEKEYLFHGYDIGDDLVHVSGEINYVFPQDGGLVKIEKTGFVNGYETVRTAVYKDDNLLIMHIVNPMESNNIVNEPDDTNDATVDNVEHQDSEIDCEKPEEDNKSELIKAISNLPILPDLPIPLYEESYMSVTLDDGMQIGVAPAMAKDVYEKSVEIQSKITNIKMAAVSLPSSNLTTSYPKASSPKGKRKLEDEAKRQEELDKQNELEMREKIEQLSHEILELRKSNLSRSNMKVACPDGLHVSFFHDEIVEAEYTRMLYVKQERPFETISSHPFAKGDFCSAINEKSRKITTDGSVIKFMIDGSVKVLLADGGVCTISNQKLGESPINLPSDQTVSGEALDTEPELFHWYLINSKGERFYKKADGSEIQLNDAQISHATCPKSMEMMETREDGTVIISRLDGTRIVEHNDGTRITTFVSQKSKRKEEETGEEELPIADFIQWIKVECVGFATVLINKKDDKTEAIFGNGTAITASITGTYNVSKQDSTKIVITENGDVIFVPKDVSSPNLPVESLSSFVEEDHLPTGIYLFKNSSMSCFSTVDCNGNKFTISTFGNALIDKAESNERSHSDNCEDNMSPRYFVLNRDGGGEELLHANHISEYLENAEKIPNVAVLKSDNSDKSEMIGITILKPLKGYLKQTWIKEKDEKEIIPSGLKERDFKTFPATERRNIEPDFKFKAGMGFQPCKSSDNTITSPIVCPNLLHMRHIVKFAGLTDTERKSLLQSFESYRECMARTDDIEHQWQPLDPRSEEEKAFAADLSTKLFNKLNLETSSQSGPEDLAENYMRATAPPISPPMPKAMPQRSQVEWEKDKIQIAELKFARDYLRSSKIPPYFDTEEGQSFLYGNGIGEDLKQIVRDLAKETVNPSKRPKSIESNGDYDDDINGYQPGTQVKSLSGKFLESTKKTEGVSFISGLSAVDSENGVTRPDNPTPGMSVQNSQDANTGSKDYPQRPYNPTPMMSIANSRNNCPNFLSTQQEDEQLCEEDNSDMDINRKGTTSNKNADLTVTGQPRKVPLRLPQSILGSRPGAMSNEKFANVEESVRRQVKTASVAGSVNPAKTRGMRGFQLRPDFVDFGVLKEGMTYSHSVVLHNVGIDSCRFKVTQPPPSTGLKVQYNAGSIAAGMSVKLNLEIFAIAVGVEGDLGAGSISHHIEIITETDIIYLPVTAIILTAHEYDKKGGRSNGPAPNTILLSERPTYREQLTRPRKN